MNINLNNARAIFTQNQRFCGDLFPKIRIKFEGNYALFYIDKFDEKSSKKVQFDKKFIPNSHFIDSRYFSNFFKNSLLSINLKSWAWSILFEIPREWVLSCQTMSQYLPSHQIEREVILYFQKKYHINLNEYDFFLNEKHGQAMAVRKKIVQNLNQCFAGIKLYKPLRFLIPQETDDE